MSDFLPRLTYQPAKYRTTTRNNTHNILPRDRRYLNQWWHKNVTVSGKCDGVEKRWKRTWDTDSPDNWEGRKLPCEGKAAILPRHHSHPVSGVSDDGMIGIMMMMMLVVMMMKILFINGDIKMIGGIDRSGSDTYHHHFDNNDDNMTIISLALLIHEHPCGHIW